MPRFVSDLIIAGSNWDVILRKPPSKPRVVSLWEKGVFIYQILWPVGLHSSRFLDVSALSAHDKWW